MKKTFLFAFALILCLGNGEAYTQIRVQTKTYNSFRPSKEKVQAIEKGLEEVSQMVEAERPVKEFGAQIVQLEKMVEEIRAEFKRYKKLSEWDAELVRINARTDELFAREQALLKEKRAAEAAKAKVERQRKEAIGDIKSSLWHTDAKNSMNYFKSKASFSKANSFLQAWKPLEKKIQTFYSQFPGEDHGVEEANEVEVFFKGGFPNACRELLSTQAQEDDAIVEKVWQEKPNVAIKLLASRLSLQKALVGEFPDESAFSAGLASTEKRYKELFAYRDGGGWAVWKLDQVKLPPAEGRDPGIESHIRKALTKEGYEVMLVRMRAANWTIHKNQYGIPEYKSKGAVAAVKKDGECMKIFGNFRKSYAGGGTYNSTGYFRWNDPQKMNCANVK